MQAVMSNKWKELLKGAGVSALIVGAGWLVGMLSGADSGYTGLVRPNLTPPDWVFSLVWPVLYALMGASLYLTLREENGAMKTASLVLFGMQLFHNFAWPFTFFLMRNYLLSFIVLSATVSLTLALIMVNFRLNKASAVLLIPYLAWLIFAEYLGIMIYAYNL